MSFRITIEPMSGRAEKRAMGDTSGLWKIVAYDEGSGSISPRNPPKRVLAENLQYDEALRLSGEYENRLNADS